MNRDTTVREVIETILVAAAGPHPDPEVLVAYRDGTLPPADEQRVQGHLVACRECAALLLDLDGLADPGFGAGEALPEGAGETIWRNVREAIRKEEPAVNVVPFLRKPPAGTPRWLQALAASLLLTTLALSGWVAVLRNRAEELSSPQLNPQVLDLYPASSVRGEDGLAGQVSAHAGWLTVILHPAGERPTAESFGVEVVRADGSRVWQQDGLKPDHDSFLIALHRDSLGAGDFRIRLVGIGPEGRRTTIGEYALRIE